MTALPAANALERILLAAPRSFCAGVDRAIQIVETALAIYPKPVYVRKEIVHNRTVVDQLAAAGAVFVDELDEVPEGGVCIFSAHGVSPAVHEQAAQRGLKVIDATCPLVTKVHVEVLKFVRDDYPTVLIGHAGHEETEGTLGEAPGEIRLIQTVEDVAKLPFPDDAPVRWTTQTTLSMDDTDEIVQALRQRFPNAYGPKKDDICYATQNRQNAVKAVAQRADTVIVLGASNSSNSKRLAEVAQRSGARSFLIPRPSEVTAEMVVGARVIGVTAGASTPEFLVQELVDLLCAGRNIPVEPVDAAVENVRFPLPSEIAAARSPAG